MSTAHHQPRPESTTLADLIGSSRESETPDWPDEDFCKRLPKIELHAHLTGSIRRETLGEIWRRRKEQEPDFDLEDPLVAIPPGKVDFDLTTEWSVEHATRQVLRDFESDGVVYLELRTIPRAFDETGLTKEKYITTILSTIRSFQSETMHTRLILAIDRQNTKEEALDTVELAIKYKSEGLVVGVDLCGNPAAGDVRIFREAFKKAKQNDLGITLHFAEIERQPIKDELDILLSFEPQRLGHAIHIERMMSSQSHRAGNTDDRILREIRQRKLCIELCLSCNVYAKMLPNRHGNGSSSFQDHHFKYWWKTDCPVALGTDDVGVFLSDLSNEYYLASTHFRVNKYELWHLVFYSIDAIFADQSEKDRLKSSLLAWGKENNLDVGDDDESVNEIIDHEDEEGENSAEQT
ncbi:hypothetical protein AOL_s00004g439 [Orbilia oligospora ATCC 24927]|uniref:Adenosine deaminase domain-containing protein n=1 Tax=Arthrobotrys oligospora (strain ATCC 24927 / CBS 115.81 / DSM 1491) TaxID=756982 RepID=G1WYS8_ARTOA|nr:hypothetical protein AOL_s00004g439 [Orbilia oligospora ATCC 24927]EGX53780.1 hypothetical protein AOL_s00004g439 [Orbilia oligospora ATCC 24927]